jgi:hypothetical protein
MGWQPPRFWALARGNMRRERRWHHEREKFASVVHHGCDGARSLTADRRVGGMGRRGVGHRKAQVRDSGFLQH